MRGESVGVDMWRRKDQRSKVVDVTKRVNLTRHGSLNFRKYI